jgi:hypothetical protein
MKTLPQLRSFWQQLQKYLTWLTDWKAAAVARVLPFCLGRPQQGTYEIEQISDVPVIKEPPQRGSIPASPQGR